MQEQLINEGDVVNCGDAISMIEVVKMSQEEMNDEMLFNSAPNQEQQQQNEQSQKQGRFSAFLDLWIVIVGAASIYFAINPDTQQQETGRKDEGEVEQENTEKIVKGKEENFAYLREYLKNNNKIQ